MSKKPDIGAPEDPLDSSESQEEDSFVFELFDYDEEDSEDEVEFAVGTETPDVAPQPVAPPEGGVYSKSSGDAPSMVEDLAPAPSDAAAPRQDASLSPDVDNGVLGRINLRTVSPQEMRRQQAVEQLAKQTGSGSPVGASQSDVHRAQVAPARGRVRSSRMDEPLPPWFEDADELDIAWPWEGGSDAKAEEAPPAAQPQAQPEAAVAPPAYASPPPPPSPPPLPPEAPPMDRPTAGFRAAMDGMVKAALDDWVEEPTDALSGFDNQPTIPIDTSKMENLGKYLERVSAQRQDVLQVLIPSQAPLPPELDEETRQKVEETRALFQNIHMVLQSIWAEGGCQFIPGGPVVLDMSMVGPAIDWLLDLLDRRGELRLEISPYELLLHGRTVMSSEVARDNPFYHLYQEGARLLTIMPGITELEFKELFRILTWSPAKDAPKDATTMLWEMDLPHLRLLATGATSEQLLGDDEVMLAEQFHLVRLFNRSLHGEQAFTDPVESAERAESALLEHVLRLRLELVRSLEQVSGEDAYRQVRAQIGNLGSDQMQRLVHTLLELMGATSQSALYVSAASGLLEHLLVLGRWKSLRVFCRTLGLALQKENPDPIRRAAALIQAGLSKLLGRDLLTAMEPSLDAMSRSQFHGFRELVRVLPRLADGGLVMVTEHVHNDEIQEMLLELIDERGINMELVLTKRLLSEDDREVMDGIGVLKAASSNESIDAIRSTLGHENPEVRITALKALAEHLSETLIPDIVDCLELDHEKLKGTAFELLDKGRQDKAAMHLIPLLESLATQWTPEHRKRALRILVRAGDNESYGFLVKHITTRNLLRDPEVEDYRKEVLDTLAGNGGMFSRKVLTDCLNQNWTFGSTRAAIQEALARLSKGS